MINVKYINVEVFEYRFYADDGISFLNLRFENDVEMYGTQTIKLRIACITVFENDVEMYGTQTRRTLLHEYYSLRMM